MTAATDIGVESQQQRALAVTFALFAGITLLLFLFSLTLGPAPIAWRDCLLSLLGESDSRFARIVIEIRLPRALLAVLIGGGLGLAGAALQGLLRNPLAEPGIVGVSACSALGAVLAFYSGLSASFAFALPAGGILGAAGAALVLNVLADRNANTLSFILGGVAVNSFAGALTALALNLSPNPYAAYEIFFWLMGSLADRSLSHVYLSLPFMLVGWALLLSTGRALHALALGEDVARSLGVNLLTLRRIVIIGIALCVGPGVAVAGMIGFIGLIVPHVLRPLVGHNPARLLPLSILGGAALTTAADICARLLTTNTELKLGVVTALIGAPFFLFLILRSRVSFA